MISGTLVVLDGDGKVLGFGKGYAMKDSNGVNGTFDENAGVLSGCTAGFPYDIDMSAVSQVLYLIDYAYTY